MNTSLKALHLFGYYLPDTQVWAFKLLMHLSDVELLVGSKNFLDCDFYLPQIKYIRLPIKQIDNPNNWILIRLVNRLIGVGQSIYPIYLKWILQKNMGSCNIIHSHFAPYAWQYMNMARKMNIPHVVSFYGFDYEYLPFTRSAWRRRYKALFKTANMFLCEGRNGAAILERSGCPSEKIQVARLGVDVDSIPRMYRSKSSGELHLIQIAAFTEKKGHLYTVRAFNCALRNCPNMTLTLVGEDRSGIRKQLCEEVKQSGAVDKIFIKDSIDYNQLHFMLNKFHVFIHPSCYTERMDCEGGAPVVLLDAQATGMPVISTHHCDIADEVIHGRTGVLCPEKDIQSIAAAISQFYFMGQEEYDQYAQNAREHVVINYDVRKNAGKLRGLYDLAIRQCQFQKDVDQV